MGDIADSIINGEFDSVTGEYLGEGFGYPRTNEPGEYNTIQGSKGYKGRHSSIKRIKKYLMNFPGLEPCNYHLHCLNFINANMIERKDNSNSWPVVADVVQTHWYKFVTYTTNAYKKKP